MPRSLIVLPDDSARPIVDAIQGAEKSLRVKMFVFSDPDLLKGVIAAHGRGVKVQIMLNPARRDGKEENQRIASSSCARRASRSGTVIHASISLTKNRWWWMTRQHS